MFWKSALDDLLHALCRHDTGHAEADILKPEFAIQYRGNRKHGVLPAQDRAGDPMKKGVMHLSLSWNLPVLDP